MMKTQPNLEKGWVKSERIESHLLGDFGRQSDA